MRATNPPLASSGMTDCSFRCGQSSLLEHEAQRLEADRRGQLHLDEPFGEQLEAPVLGASGPGRPGWLPTQVPHRSGLAHDAHPVPHLMNSRPARSVVGTWTWFRSRCTCQVSLQRLMRRHPLPSTGSLGLVPPLPRYYEVLRLPAAHFAALRFLRLAIPSLRPLFVPPGPGRGAVDQSGVGRRYLQPPCSMETTGSPKFPEVPL